MLGATHLNFARLAGLHFLEFTLERDQPTSNDAAINLQLLLARTARSYADRRSARDLTKVRPHRAQSGRGVLKLRDLHLQLRFAGSGAVGEDIEDQLAAIDDLDLDFLLE